MSALKLNGIEVDTVVSVSDLKHATRDIGERETAADGSLVITRSARKLDLFFTTVLLSLELAQIWWSFFTGEGEVWSFDTSLYGSKGTGPSSVTNTAVSAGSAKYGAGKLEVGASGSITWDDVTANSFGRATAWTVCVWRTAGSEVHYVVNSLGQKWVDGVRNDVASTTWLAVSSGDLTISNGGGAAVIYDDLVVVPYVMPEDWPAQVHAAGAAFGPLPAHAATGDLVAEQTTRLVVGTAEEGMYVKTGSALMQSLTVELGAR